MNSNRSYSPKTFKLGFDLCDLDLWPLTLTFCMDITLVIGNDSWKFHWWWWWYDDGNIVKKVSQTDGQTDGNSHSQSGLVGAQNTTLGFNSIISVLYTRISTMRCSRDLVVALTDTSDAFLWGLGGPPQLVQHGCDFPRELFAKGDMPDSGGTVFLQWPSGKLWGPGMHENYHWLKRYFSLILGVCWH